MRHLPLTAADVALFGHQQSNKPVEDLPHSTLPASSFTSSDKSASCILPAPVYTGWIALAQHGGFSQVASVCISALLRSCDCLGHSTSHGCPLPDPRLRAALLWKERHLAGFSWSCQPRQPNLVTPNVQRNTLKSREGTLN